jgi:formamidopyrimidine-DNA glycosylase
MQTCDGCCGDTYEIPATETCNVVDCEPCEQVESDSSASDGISMIAWSAIIIGIIAVLVLGVLFMRRSAETEVETATSITQTSVHAPCTSCGGPAHETLNNGNRWTWCPSCRQWLNYLGKE